MNQPPMGQPPMGQSMPTFYLQRMGAEEGPYGIPDMQAQARAKYITATTMVRRADGQGTWFHAGGSRVSSPTRIG